MGGTTQIRKEVSRAELDMVYCKLMTLASFAKDLEIGRRLIELNIDNLDVIGMDGMEISSCTIKDLVKYLDDSRYFNSTDLNGVTRFIREQLSSMDCSIKPYGFLYDFRTPDLSLSASQALIRLAVNIQVAHNKLVSRSARASVLLPRYYMMKSGMDEIAETKIDELIKLPLLPVSVGILHNNKIGLLRYGFNEDLLPIVIDKKSESMQQFIGVLHLIKETFTGN